MMMLFFSVKDDLIDLQIGICRNQKNGIFVREPLSLKAYIYLKLIASIDDKIELKILEDNDNE
mgnify:CR=1 FL=1